MLAALCGISLAGVLAATLWPKNATDHTVGLVCEVGASARAVLSTQQGQFNVALFVPVCLFAVMMLKQPLTVLAGGALLSGAVEVAQSALPLGRACDTGDFVANFLGVVVGTVLGMGVVLAGRRKIRFGTRAAVRGTGAFGVGLAAVALVFHFALTPVRDAGGMVGSTSAQNDAAHTVAAKLFGPTVRVTAVQLMESTPDSPAQIWVTTNQGRIQLNWPSRELVSAMSTANYDDGGTLSKERMRTVAERFASDWFPADVRGSRASFRPIASTTRAMVLTYRRYRSGIMMPMRLDLTVSSSGRIISVQSQDVPDPQLPKPEISEERARKLAVDQADGERAGTTFLLAQKVSGVWRPCWAVDILRTGESEPVGTVFLDAVTGQVAVNRG